MEAILTLFNDSKINFVVISMCVLVSFFGKIFEDSEVDEFNHVWCLIFRQ